jgi:hypothetical protein
MHRDPAAFPLDDLTRQAREEASITGLMQVSETAVAEMLAEIAGADNRKRRQAQTLAKAPPPPACRDRIKSVPAAPPCSILPHSPYALGGDRRNQLVDMQRSGDSPGHCPRLAPPDVFHRSPVAASAGDPGPMRRMESYGR